jgi:hypothetical protein
MNHRCVKLPNDQIVLDEIVMRRPAFRATGLGLSLGTVRGGLIAED